MNKWLAIAFGVALCLAESRAPLMAADPAEEQRMVQVLQSENAGLREKDAACSRLKLVGTEGCVPAVALLLTNEALSHSARLVLEAMQAPEAGRALLDALAKTKGNVRLGIINSLAVREEKEAVPFLVDLLADPDLGTARAAVAALGRIGGPDAVTALRDCARKPGSGLHAASADALLRCANRMLASGQRSFALAIFEQLDTPAEKEVIEAGAFRGRVLASGNAGLSMVLHALAGAAGPSQMAALQLARTLQVPHATRELARLLPALQPTVQIAVIEALAQRGDVSVIPELRKFATSAPAELRLSLIRVFDNVGDGSVVPLLGLWAASGPEDIRSAARAALSDLHHGNVSQALIEELSKCEPGAQGEIARALGMRRDTAAVPRLVQLAQQGPGPVRNGALQALSALIDARQLPALVDLTLYTKDEEGRSHAAEALNAACQRLRTKQGGLAAQAVVTGLQNGPGQGRIALLPICSGLIDPQVRSALRGCLSDPDPGVRSAAVRALCDTIDGDLLDDVLGLARGAQDDVTRSLAVSGGVRLVTQEDTVKLPASRRVQALKSLFSCASGPTQKRQVLAGLAEVPEPESLELIAGALDDPAVRNEAARAVVKIAASLPGDKSLLSLKKALVAVDDESTRKAVEAAITGVPAKPVR
ncbi:MAG TPA: HEAT repeat domain-containing protein [Verrucomicrobiae bacterium]|nr:HEAT repeat domain-containing protein [Verrucomicrobiae bacterium]